MRTLGIHAWLLGQVSDLATAPIQDGVEVVQGTKGVDGGSVQVVGTSPR
jgi:phosphoribosylformylglycinamidine cyclo-ligase